MLCPDVTRQVLLPSVPFGAKEDPSHAIKANLGVILACVFAALIFVAGMVAVIYAVRKRHTQSRQLEQQSSNVTSMHILDFFLSHRKLY